MPQILSLPIPNGEFLPNPGERILEWSAVEPRGVFREVIPSWNVRHANGVSLTIELRTNGPAGKSEWWNLGTWSLDRDDAPRQSLKGQRTPLGNVATDTLELKQSARTVDVRLKLRTLKPNSRAKLERFTLAFTNGKTPAMDRRESHVSWGKVVRIPKRYQALYPRGNVLCSPTSTSMVLWHYAQKLDRPELNVDVPVVEEGVWDTVYNGAGNWPFNTAFAGSFEGMRAYVARFAHLRDLEEWIASDLPVICSVSYDLLRGRPLSPTESGHLVVLVGFTKDGDPVFNDPARRNEVTTVFKRADFERGWRYSNRTVYVIHPESAVPPSPNFGRWLP